MKVVNIITLGCAKNRVDSEHIAAQLAEVGYEVRFDSDRTDAKVVVINTCGFIGHQGMQGWICDPRNIDDSWLVNFPQCGEKRDIATIAVKEKDLKQIPVMYASVNEQIKAKFENSENSAKAFIDTLDDISGYLI